MGQHPINLAVRFFLELAALFSVGYWGWTQHQGLLRYVLAIGLPLIAAVAWATFRVANEPNSGDPIIAVPGLIRLILELTLFASATWALYNAGATRYAWIFGGMVLAHYLVSYDRVGWLLRQT